MRIVFFGTPEFAVPTLDAVAAAHEVVLVVAQPDRPAGRGMRLQQPAVAVRARELGLPLAQPLKIRADEFAGTIAGLAPDAAVVVAYGRILPRALLQIPKHGFLNVHGSLLPKYRGAAPIQRAIAAGEPVTGVTIMRVDEQLDHGPMLARVAVDIGRDERARSVVGRLALTGAEAMVRTLAALASGSAVETPQDHDQATLAPKIEKEEGRVDFSEPARVIYDRFRAFDPWPGIFFESGGETIKVRQMSRSGGGSAPPRHIVEIGRSVTVGTGEGTIRLDELQRPGKPRALAGDVARGLGWRIGARLP